MDANQLDELERLFKKAAPGWALDSPDADDPWWVNDDAPVSFVAIYRGRSLGTVVVGNIVSRDAAKLIVAARNALPELIAAARELERTRSMLTNYEETAALVRSQQLSMAERDELAQLRRDLAAAREGLNGKAPLEMAVHEIDHLALDRAVIEAADALVSATDAWKISHTKFMGSLKAEDGYLYGTMMNDASKSEREAEAKLEAAVRARREARKVVGSG